MKTTSWIATAIVALYLVVQLVGLPSSALTDDDDFYIPAGISYATWLGQAVRFDRKAWSRAGIDAAFEINREHPPFAKYVFGLSHFAFRGWLGPYDAARVGTVLFSTLTAALLLFMAMGAFGAKRGLRVGGLAVLTLLTLPRFYFHSHAATLDVPVAAMYLATAALILRAERSLWAALWAGPVFGLATATKLNAPFIVVPYILFVVLTRWRERSSIEGSGLRLPPVPLAMFSMAVIGPLVFFAVWPWMWFDVAPRVGEYVSFHVKHYGIYFLYFGRIFSSNPFGPWHAPFVMAAITVPLATSGLALYGVWRSVPAVWFRVRRTPTTEQRRIGDLLLFCGLNAFVTIGVVAFLGTPKYGGAKLFMPFFPFWCLFAGFGANTLYESFVRGASTPLRRAWPAAAVGVLAASGLMFQLKLGGYGLSQYNGLIGGTRGATATGFERQYYDLAFRDLVAWMSEEAPQNLRVHFLPNNWEYVRTYKWYRRAGELRKDIRVVNSEGQADWVVITHERRFARYGADLSRYRQKKVLREKVIDGTPIWSVVQAR